MKYGYARVSTTDQKLANQIELLKLAGAQPVKVFTNNRDQETVNQTFDDLMK
ncbi:hypothetical protein EQJ27_15335 (plasmid) [Lactiplantibacillus plantarum]|nr:hypothetical protein EQJ27_15335 [Lactiplantibacillus plantarum]